MMSVASKTKTKMFSTVALGFVVVTVALPTLASTTPGFVPLAPVQPFVVSTSGQQDLSVLRAKLKERFSGVATEVNGLVGGLHGASSVSDDTAVRTLDVRQGIGNVSPLFGQNYFVDIGDDPYRSYINRLFAFGVLASSSKFYPQNYFRIDDFTALFAKLYQKTSHQSIDFATIVGIDTKDGVMTKGLLQQMMYAAKNTTVISLDGEPYDKLMRSEGAYYLVRLFNLPILSVESSSFVSTSPFSDIAGHASANAVHTLASLDVVNTTATKFYPDNYVRHYDFVLLLVNALSLAHGQTLSTPSYSSFADVDGSSSYLPQLTYAHEHGIIDSLIAIKGGQFYFAPNDFVSKAQVYSILSTVLPLSFVYDANVASTQKISRGELAQLLVESFQLQAKKIESESPTSTDLGTGDLSLLTKVKVLLSLL